VPIAQGSRWPQRAWCASGVLLFGVCVVGCMNAPFKARAVYGPELEFRAVAERDSFDEMYWNDTDKKLPACPVVIHAPGGDISDEQMRSAKALLDMGAREIQNDGGRQKNKVNVTVMMLDRGASKITTFYHDDRLVSVIVRVSGPTRVTIHGKQVSLPLPRAGLLETFGQPAQMIE
jgi:hypothetical protein